MEWTWNRRQRLSTTIGVAVVVTMLLVPPWRSSFLTAHGVVPHNETAYRPIWSPPRSADILVSYEVDLTRLFVQALAASIVTAYVTFATRSRLTPTDAENIEGMFKSCAEIARMEAEMGKTTTSSPSQ